MPSAPHSSSVACRAQAAEASQAPPRGCCRTRTGRACPGAAPTRVAPTLQPTPAQPRPPSRPGATPRLLLLNPVFKHARTSTSCCQSAREAPPATSAHLPLCLPVPHPLPAVSQAVPVSQVSHPAAQAHTVQACRGAQLISQPASHKAAPGQEGTSRPASSRRRHGGSRPRPASPVAPARRGSRRPQLPAACAEPAQPPRAEPASCYGARAARLTFVRPAVPCPPATGTATSSWASHRPAGREAAGQQDRNAALSRRRGGAHGREAARGGGRAPPHSLAPLAGRHARFGRAGRRTSGRARRPSRRPTAAGGAPHLLPLLELPLAHQVVLPRVADAQVGAGQLWVDPQAAASDGVWWWWWCGDGVGGVAWKGKVAAGEESGGSGSGWAGQEDGRAGGRDAGSAWGRGDRAGTQGRGRRWGAGLQQRAGARAALTS